jgi:hypothetical protein
MGMSYARGNERRADLPGTGWAVKAKAVRAVREHGPAGGEGSSDDVKPGRGGKDLDVRNRF